MLHRFFLKPVRSDKKFFDLKYFNCITIMVFSVNKNSLVCMPKLDVVNKNDYQDTNYIYFMYIKMVFRKIMFRKTFLNLLFVIENVWRFLKLLANHLGIVSIKL